MTAERVKVIQNQLAAAGFNPGPIDGRMGPQTETAIRNYQASRGLTVDGIVGPLTTQDLATNAPATTQPGQNTAGGTVPFGPGLDAQGKPVQQPVNPVAAGSAPPAPTANTSAASAADTNFANAILGATGQTGSVSINAADQNLTAFLQPFLNIPDLANVLTQASDPNSGGPWDQTRFEAAIMSTPWWQNNSEQARAYAVMPPGQQQQLIQQYAAQVWDQANTSFGRGFLQSNPDWTNMSSGMVQAYANAIASGKMTMQQAQAEIRSMAETNPATDTFQNAVSTAKNTIANWGLGNTVDDIINQGVMAGKNNDAIVADIRKSQAYAAQFPGQALRKQNGLSALDENQYNSIISSYQNALREYGINPSTLDVNSLGQLIGNDITGTEMNERLSYLNTVATTFGPTMRAAFEQHAGLKVDDADLYAMFNGQNPELANQYAKATGTPTMTPAQMQAAIGGAGTGLNSPTSVASPSGSQMLGDLQILGTGAISDASLKNAMDRATSDEKAMFHQLSREANEPALVSAVPKGTF